MLGFGHKKKVNEFVDALHEAAKDDEKVKELTEKAKTDLKRSFRSLGKAEDEFRKMIEAIQALSPISRRLTELNNRCEELLRKNNASPKELQELNDKMAETERLETEYYNRLFDIGKVLTYDLEDIKDPLDHAQTRIIRLISGPFERAKQLRMKVFDKTDLPERKKKHKEWGRVNVA